MNKDRSTKDLSLSSNERLHLQEDHSYPFKFPALKNIKSRYVKFYTFHSGFKKNMMIYWL